MIFSAIPQYHGYAVLFFDLIAVVYSSVTADGFDPAVLVMALVFAVAITLYIFNGGN